MELSYNTRQLIKELKNSHTVDPKIKEVYNIVLPNLSTYCKDIIRVFVTEYSVPKSVAKETNNLDYFLEM